MKENEKKIVQQNSPEEGFLQSEDWRKFQESVGKKTYRINGLNIIEHKLSVVGKYFYIPRWSENCHPEFISGSNKMLKPASPAGEQVQHGINEILKLAKENNAGWVRIEPENEEILNVIKNSTKYKIAKAPHDMQPKEILVMDITKTEEQLLAEMKAKTRYNIRLAEKKKIKVIRSSGHQVINKKYIDEFLRLVKLTAERKKIKFHPENYYRKMMETINSDITSLYMAEYENKIIAANIVVFYGDVCTYLHGASYDEYRNVMAPYLLQWQAIKDAKVAGCKMYDLGGVNTKMTNDKCQISNQCQNSNEKIPNTKYQILDTKWQGITRFKLGFSPNTQPIEFPGSYDIIINSGRYLIYNFLRRIRNA